MAIKSPNFHGSMITVPAQSHTMEEIQSRLLKKKKKSKTVNLIYTGLKSLVSVGFLNLNNIDVLVE